MSKKWVIIMDKRQYKTATSTQAETSGLSAQDRYYARGTGGGAKKERGNGDEYRGKMAHGQDFCRKMSEK